MHSHIPTSSCKTKFSENPFWVAKEEIATKVKEVIQEVGAESIQDIGKVMGCLKSSLAGSADMGLVSKVVKDQLS